jgi:hypothetical protein
MRNAEYEGGLVCRNLRKEPAPPTTESARAEPTPYERNPSRKSPPMSRDTHRREPADAPARTREPEYRT